MLSDQVKSRLSGMASANIAKHIAVDSQKTTKAISEVTPVFVSALGRNVSTKKEAEALAKALKEDHTGAWLSKVDQTVVSPEKLDEGAKILKHVFGNQQSTTINTLSNNLGMDQSQVQQLLTSVAPVVLEQLGKLFNDGNMDVNQLTQLLTKEKVQVDPAIGSLAQLFDSNKNGSILDEIWGFIQKILNYFSGKR